MMKVITYLWVLLFGCIMVSAAEPIAERGWKAKSGHEVRAVALKVENGKVHLKKADGKTVIVPVHKLVDADQELLKKHFEISDDAAKGEGSGAETAANLPHPLGKVSGPVDAGGGSTYYVYLPKSLKAGRKAPMLFYTNSGGGNPGLIKGLTDYAELFGWVLAISVESSNQAGWDKNSSNCKNCLEHILDNLPVDEKRLHYTGNSGGGAQAFVNTEIKKAYGVMPNIGYIPQGVEEKTSVIYGLGGGHDYNRYLTAYAVSKYKKNGFHRMAANGHGSAPDDHRGDGMFWMHCKFLAKEKGKHSGEAKDFELSALGWLETMKDKNPQRAYSNAIVFKEIYGPSGANASALDKLIKDLASAPDNVLYHEALLEINEVSKKYFAPLGKNGGSSFNHENSKSNRAVTKLKETYGHIPAISKVLDAMLKNTAGK